MFSQSLNSWCCRKSLCEHCCENGVLHLPQCGMKQASLYQIARACQAPDVLSGSHQHLEEVLQELMEEALISLNNAKQELDFTKTGEDAESLQAALEEAAAAYKALHIKACSAGVPVPKEAMIQSNEQTVWSKEDLIGARDWMKFADAGWTVMEDLPELPEIFDTTFYIAHNQSEPPDVIVPISALPLGPPFC